MTISGDAGELLAFIYEEYTKKDNTWIQNTIVIEKIKWDSGRINRAIDYLCDLDLIKIN